MNIKHIAMTWGMLLLGVILNVAGSYIIKLKINTFGDIQLNSLPQVFSYFLALAKQPIVVLGGLTLLFATLPYAIALAKMELSVAYPASVALNFLFIIPLTIILLHEPLTLSKVLSSGLIILGLFILYR